MKRLPLTSLLLLLCTAVEVQAGPADLDDLMRGGEIVVDQQPTRFGGPGSDTLFRNVFGEVVWQQIAENILLDAPATIGHLTWWGFYGGSGTPATPPPDTETMRLRFYGARPGDGLPDDGNILYEESFLDPSRTATGEIVLVGGSPDEYVYSVDLASPVSLGAGTLYWLEIEQIGDIDTTFRWEAGISPLAGHAFAHTYLPAWELSPSTSLAFQLVAVPESSTLLLLLLLVAAVGLARRRRKEVLGIR